MRPAFRRRTLFPSIFLSSFPVKCRHYSSTKEKPQSFTKTVLLPKTNFKPYIELTKEKELLQSALFSGLYERQRQDTNRQNEFVLHDGPPYANGEPHLGHAVNKILKDILLRYEMAQGSRVHFVPGWDCHGLPIELKVKSVADATDVIGLRRSAAEFAIKTMQSQREHFMSWAVAGDWNDPYLTSSTSYILKELDIFFTLFAKGLIFRNHLPVYWSLEHETALAEAELEYRDNHVSPSLYVKFPISFPIIPDLHALIWTTTPWTLPSNEAICFAPQATYSIIKLNSDPSPLIVASDRLSILEQELGPHKVLQQLSPDEMADLRYRHPNGKRGDRNHPFISSYYVTMEKGTGLMHSAPNHGKEDNVIALQNNMQSGPCIVDEKGLFNASAGDDLVGKSVLHEGNEAVMAMWSANIVHRGSLEHSYPYDWRSKKPVIIRPSQQWFFNTQAVRDECLKALDNVVIHPPQLKKTICNMIGGRPHWCISRQRVWGVPIPAFFHVSDKERSQPLLDRDIFSSVVKHFEKHGPDSWWTSTPEQLLPDSLKHQASDLVKSNDILDIWFDSGVSWSSVLSEGKKADYYLEGSDQMRGWFLSSLITSVAVSGSAPYKSIFVHGFTVDEEGRKMSKSVGNVINPADLVHGNKKRDIPAFGVDVLRWWVFREANDHTNYPVYLASFQVCQTEVVKVRNTIRFMIANLYDFKREDILPFDQLIESDRMMLAECYERSVKFTSYIKDGNLKDLQFGIHNYVENLSSIYFLTAKSRLYCSIADSVERRSAQTTLWHILTVLSQFVAPVLPLSMEEAYTHFPDWEQGKSFFERQWFTAPAVWENGDHVKLLSLIRQMKSLFNKSLPAKSLREYDVFLQCHEDSETLHLVQRLPERQWTDFLHVSSVHLRGSPQDYEIVIPPDEEFCPVGVCLRKGNLHQCPRCRNFFSTTKGEVCAECHQTLLHQSQ